MSTRLRVMLTVAAACATVLILASVASVLLVQSNLRSSIDSGLQRSLASTMGDDTSAMTAAKLCVRLRSPSLIVATASGAYMSLARGSRELCRSNLSRPTVAASLARSPGAETRTIRVAGQDLRAMSRDVGGGLRLDAVQPLDEYHSSVNALTTALVGIMVLGLLASGLAAGVAGRVATVRLERVLDDIGRSVADRSMQRPVEHVGTSDLDRVVDEVNSLLGDLRQAMAEQRQLVADAAHELRTPLTSLSTNLEVLSRTDDPRGDEGRAILRDVLVQANELSSLVGNLVELARQEQHELGVTENVALHDVVSASVDRASRLHPAAAITFECQPFRLVGDSQLLRRAIDNVVDNAVKFGDGRVDVLQCGPVITVRDHGPGFGDDDPEQLIRPFHRAASARSVPGSGLGLAFVSRVVALHHGDLHLESPADGSGGAVVRIDLHGAGACP